MGAPLTCWHTLSIVDDQYLQPTPPGRRPPWLQLFAWRTGRGIAANHLPCPLPVMKFGKRLLAEAERRWLPYYLDYKALKRAIQADVDAKGAPPGSRHPLPSRPMLHGHHGAPRCC